MHRYRTHTCNALGIDQVGETARLSGWIHRRRDHGQLVFLDLRDHFGITQCVVDVEDDMFGAVEGVRVESVVTITGRVVRRDPETVNPKLPTGQVEIRIDAFEVRSEAGVLPLQVNAEEDAGEDIRLRYRFLDLRRERIHGNILLRSSIIASIRRRMVERGFVEFQTPILTASSPEGARDFLVPSRLHPGKFYALPQAPQQFKQLVMMSGFDRYFQIAPCFRDEDSRADRSPGEFYQLDVEMSFVEQEDVFNEIEPVLAGVFEEFSDWSVPCPFPRIPYAEAMLKYGTDKPDLRNPLEICDVSDLFVDSDFAIFARTVADGGVVRAIPGPGVRQPGDLRPDECMGPAAGRARNGVHHPGRGRRSRTDRVAAWSGRAGATEAANRDDGWRCHILCRRRCRRCRTPGRTGAGPARQRP